MYYTPEKVNPTIRFVNYLQEFCENATVLLCAKICLICFNTDESRGMLYLAICRCLKFYFKVSHCTVTLLLFVETNSSYCS